MIFYGCPKCEQPMASPESMAGQKETCPNCGNLTIVPAPTYVGAGKVEAPATAARFSLQRAAAKKKTQKQTMTVAGWVILAFLVLAAWFLLPDCGPSGSAPARPLMSDADRAKQVERAEFLAKLASRQIILHLRPSAAAGVGRAKVGPGWYALSYDAKKNFASVAMAYLVCEHCPDESTFLLKFMDWKTNREVASYYASSSSGVDFTVKR